MLEKRSRDTMQIEVTCAELGGFRVRVRGQPHFSGDAKIRVEKALRVLGFFDESNFLRMRKRFPSDSGPSSQLPAMPSALAQRQCGGS
jgi:hypothetical protein